MNPSKFTKTVLQALKEEIEALQFIYTTCSKLEQDGTKIDYISDFSNWNELAFEIVNEKCVLCISLVEVWNPEIETKSSCWELEYSEFGETLTEENRYELLEVACADPIRLFNKEEVTKLISIFLEGKIDVNFMSNYWEKVV